MSELLIDWSTGKPLPGTEDWIEVARLGSSGGYEWTEFNAFYSPSARRFFWHGDSGCSCDSWRTSLESVADFENGSKTNLLRSWEAFAKEEYAITTTEYIYGLSTIKAFKVPK